MGLFNNLMSKIFGHAPAPTVAAAGTSTAPSTAGTQATAAPASAAGAPAATAPTAPRTAVQVVDVAVILDGLAAKNSEKLDWKKSIVDLMKLVDMDSSFENRKELARELGYTGDPGDSAAMNIWLHKRVMKELAAHGGKVPANMLD